MRKVTVALPTWIGKEEAQEEVVSDLRARALLKMEFYRSRAKPFEVKYGLTFSRFRRLVEKAAREDPAAWDDLVEWEAYHRGYVEWRRRHAELRRWSAT
jgi:hypothetical protein